MVSHGKLGDGAARPTPRTASGTDTALIRPLFSLAFLISLALLLRKSAVSCQAPHNPSSYAAQSWFHHGVVERTQDQGSHRPGFGGLSLYLCDFGQVSFPFWASDWPVGFPLNSGNTRVSNVVSCPQGAPSLERDTVR